MNRWNRRCVREWPWMPVVAMLMMGLLISCNLADRTAELYFPLPDEPLEVNESEDQAFSVDTLLTDLVRPWSFEFLPDGRTLITQRDGTIIQVRNGRRLPNPISGVPNGLRDVKIHPDYESNGWLYLTYYQDPEGGDGGYTVLIRGKLDGDAFVESEELYRAGPYHEAGGSFGSRLAFDHDGYLFFIIGGRTLDDRHRRIAIQDLRSLSGKTLRLFDDGTIPADNPYADSVGVPLEIYSTGHRQHQGLVVHPETGTVWSTEHGEFGGDELNIIRPGRNYGWPLATYSLEYDSTSISDDPLMEGMEPPVHYWTPSISPPGLDFAVTDRYPGWKGDLFVASLSMQLLNRSVMDGETVLRDERLLEGIGRVRTVRLGPDGWLYLLTEDNGMLLRLLPAETGS